MKENMNYEEEEFYQLLYRRLDQTLNSDQMDEIIQELEDYRMDFILQKKEKSSVNFILLLLYFVQQRPYEVCELIAEYKMDMDEIERAIQQTKMPKALRDRGLLVGDTFFEKLYNQIIDSDYDYNAYYELFEQYPCGEYAQLLILYARKEDRRTDTIILSNFMKKTFQTKMTKMNRRALYEGQYQLKPETVMLSYYTERLEDLSYTKDYKEIRKCVNEAKKEYDYVKEILLWRSPKWLPRFWINMMHCLNILERYDKTIWLSSTVELKMTDPDYYLYLAEAYYANNQMEDARKNCKRSVALGMSPNNLLLLSQIMFTQRDYQTAEKLLLQMLGIFSRKIKGYYVDSDGITYDERIVERESPENDFQKRLESPYVLLFLCYVYQEDYIKAKAFYEEMKTKLVGSDMTMISECFIQVNEKVSERFDEIEQKQEELRRQLEAAARENQEQRQLLKKWTAILTECQLENESQQVSTEYWEERLADQMENAIQEISKMVKKSNENAYQAEMVRIKKVFPKLPEKALQFFASAEQMYQVFENNEVIDFAPVMVEYCKVIEVLLWDYLDRTEEYKPEIKNNKYKVKTLGAAKYIIGQAGKGKSLFEFLESIEMVTSFRNKSAHKEALKKAPDLKKVQKLIWDSHFLQKLCL